MAVSSTPTDSAGEPGDEAAFAALQARLPGIWRALFPHDDQPYTSVVVPSLSLDPAELAHVPGAVHLEQRLLFLLMRLRNPLARIVFVTSVPVHPLVIEYHLQMLAGIPASDARRRMTLICVHDATPTPLTAKVLARPRVLDRIRSVIPNRERAYLTVLTSTPLERRLALALDLPLNAPDPSLAHLGTKTGSRRLFRNLGLPVPAGAEGLRDATDLVAALRDLRRTRPGVARAVVKLEGGFWGRGSAVFMHPESDDRAGYDQCLGRLAVGREWDSPTDFLAEFDRTGGVAEEMIEGMPASVELRINPVKRVVISSTHDQLTGGGNGLRYEGCRFPAAEPYRLLLQETGARVGRALADRGVIGRLSLEFLAVSDPGRPPRLVALAANLRTGGATHPMLALRFLTGGQYDADSGLFRSPSGVAKFYLAKDDVRSEAYRGLTPEDVIDIATEQRLAYDPRSDTGLLFHSLAGTSETGSFGLVAIGNSPEQAAGLFRAAVDVLDRECARGQ